MEHDKKGFELLGQILKDRGIPNDQAYRIDKKEWISEALERLGHHELAEAVARGRGRPPKGTTSAKSALQTLQNSDDPTLKYLAYVLSPTRAPKLTIQRVMAEWVEQEMILTGQDYQQAAYQISKRSNGWTLQDIKKAYKREFKK